MQKEVEFLPTAENWYYYGCSPSSESKICNLSSSSSMNSFYDHDIDRKLRTMIWSFLRRMKLLVNMSRRLSKYISKIAKNEKRTRKKKKRGA